MFAGYVHKRLDGESLSWLVILVGPLVLFNLLLSLGRSSWPDLQDPWHQLPFRSYFPYFPVLLKLTAIPQ